MKRRLIFLLTAAAMLAEMSGPLPTAWAAEIGEATADTPAVQLPVREPVEEPFPDIEFEEWEPVENTEHPGGFVQSPFWRAYLSPVDHTGKYYMTYMTALPEKYDLRALGRSTTVKNQYSWGTCWTFGAMAALESNILTRSGASGNGVSTSPDYSEHQLAWFAYQQQNSATLADSEVGQGQVGEGNVSDPSPLNNGGNDNLTTSVLATWQGAADESDIPYQNTAGGTGSTGNWSLPDSKRGKSAVHLTDVDFLPSPIRYSAYGSNSLPTATATYSYDKEAEQNIKRTIMEHGAVTLSYYADQSKPSGSKDGTYFNYTNNCQFVDTLNASTMPNHGVCIVGWDDSYPKTNFNPSAQPENDGAWIVKNSWGPDAYDNGYFYLSYYDRTIQNVGSLRGEIEFSYDHNYQYDYLQLGSCQTASTSARLGVANVFTAKRQEELRAVSVVTDMAGSTVTLEVYRLKAGAEGPYDGTLAATQRETIPYGGYHTLPLEAPVSLSAGERFSVVAVVERPDSYYFIPLEIGYAAGRSIAVANPGESYRVDPDSKKFEDVSKLSISPYTYGNAMLKAFTVDADPDIPSIAAQPADQAAPMDDEVTFSVTAVGDGLSYQWQLSTDHGNTWADVPGATAESYTTPALTKDMEGHCYRCRISNSHGTVFSDIAAITSVIPPATTEIYTLEDLENFRDSVNAGTDYAGKTVRLMADIDLSEKYGPGKSEWTPIGYIYGNPFPEAAVFDGGGHTVSGVYIREDTSNNRNFGLFGHNRGTIQDLGVSGDIGRYPDSSVVGGICTYNYGLITKCHYAGYAGGWHDVGGICGMNHGSITDCYNDGDISGLAIAGGICGSNDSTYGGGSITNCYNNGTVSSEYTAGGICGSNDRGSVTDCYNTGDVVVNNASIIGGDIGGICGYSYGLVTACYNTGNITLTSTGDLGRVGGICGLNTNLITDCYNTGNITGTGTSDDGIYVGGICGNNRAGADELGSISNCHNMGCVSSVSTKQCSVGGICGRNGSEFADRPLSITDCYNTGDITGTCTGNSGSYVGGVCGQNEAGDACITNCHNDGELSGNRTVGGVCGYNANSITDCYNAGEVSGNQTVGGVCGHNVNFITDCYNVGGVSVEISDTGSTGNRRIGGVCGYNFNNGSILNCYNIGEIANTTASANVGGVCGDNSNGSISNCYDAGTITGAAEDAEVGRVCGANSGSGSITNCYYLPAPSQAIGGVHMTDDVAGQVEAKTAEEFASGEVAYLLQKGNEGTRDTQVWGQSVKGIELDALPLLTSAPDKAVYKVSFYLKGGAVHAVKYANHAGISSLPDAPVSGTTKLIRWSCTEDVTGEEFTADTPISADLSVYAIGDTMYGENPGDKTITLTYGELTEPKNVDLSLYAVMGDDSSTQGKFRFTITDGAVDSVQIIDQEILQIAKDIPANEAGYPITLRAFKLSSEPVLMSAPLGSESFLFTVTVVVHKAEGSGSVSLAGWTKGQAPKTPVPLSETNGVENVTYLYKKRGAADETYSATVPTEVGKYTVLAKFAETDNYKEVERTADFAITIGAAVLKTPPTAKQGLVYNGQAQDLITAGTAENGTLQYKLGEGGTYSANIPQATESGEYTVYYKVIGDETHADTDEASISVTIAKAENEPSDGGSSGGSSSSSKPRPKKKPQSVPHVWYMQGYDDNTFRPDAPMTRAEILTILARLSDDYTGQEVSDFADVAKGSWYYSYIGYAEKLGVIKGYEDGLFYPQRQMTRAEFAAIMCRRLKLAPEDKAVFADASGHWAAGYISRLCSMEVISGYPDGTFQPERAISRAEAAKIINRIYQRAPQPEAARQKLPYTDITPTHWAWAEIVEASTDHESSDY